MEFLSPTLSKLFRQFSPPCESSPSIFANFQRLFIFADTDDSKLPDNSSFPRLAALQRYFTFSFFPSPPPPITSPSLAVDRMACLAGVTVACVALATIHVGVRLYTRGFLTGSLGFDDVLLVASLVTIPFLGWGPALFGSFPSGEWGRQG